VSALSRNRISGALAAALILASLVTLTGDRPADATPVASTDATYQACGRVFPDPHAYWPAPTSAAGDSPWAKGNASCRAVDFISYAEMIDGMTYLEGLFPDFVEFYNLEEDFGGDVDCATSTDPDDLCSAGLPQIGGTRTKSDLYLVRVTDERVDDADKKLFIFPLSIHGIERAGAEAGTRAAEDLATWGFCEAVTDTSLPANPVVDCAKEGAIPHPLLETVPDESLTAGEVLKDSAIYFMFANPDGWRRGDPDNISRFYQRYNGNGVDMNRDWPTIGYTFEPYTPWSEPETRSFGEVLKGIRGTWDGGIDLHGQLVDRAFSFTLLGASERDYSKDQRILQTVKGAWVDAEARLSWSPLIKPNDAPADDQRLYGVLWGTVWDTIAYTTTGSLGDWIDSPLGLGADGIDNEMSLSHISNCGTGTCYLEEAEQLHIDGNKSLVYAMVNYSLQPQDTDFDVSGDVAYVHSPRKLVNDGSDLTEPPTEGLPTQDDMLDISLNPTNSFTHEFEVFGPESDPAVYNGGLTGTATPLFSVGGIGGSSLLSLVLERFRPLEEVPAPAEDAGCGAADDQWEEVNRYFNQAPTYLQSGQAVHTNGPTPGLWRICVTGAAEEQIALSGGTFDLDLTFQGEQAWENPGQLPYDASNMKFFTDIAQNMKAGQLTKVTADQVLSGSVDLGDFTSVVIADDAFPGYTEGVETGPAQENPPPFANPGAGTAACAYPTNPELPPTCYTTHEFDVEAEPNNQQLIVELTTIDPASDWDLYVERQSAINGEWFGVAQSTSSGGNERATLLSPPTGHYRAKVVNWSASSAGAESLTVAFSNEYAGPPIPDSDRSQAQLNKWGQLLETYASGGGNLVLTDGALTNVAHMGLVPRSFVNNFSVYAGFVGFTRDGLESTYEDPLAQNVNQPGAAEGPQFRHQTYEPVPLGYSIQDAAGADYNSSPVWAIDQAKWEAAGGRTAGITTGDQVTLGELKVGKGQVRVIGALLPMPTEQYFHPFGLANYAVTYTGYQVLKNALQAGGGGEGGLCPALGEEPGSHIVGTEGRDILVGTPGDDFICGYAGNDVLRGGDGDDVIVAGPGNDRVKGGDGDDRLYGQTGNDIVSGGAGNDRLLGGNGRDRLRGGAGDDLVRGWKGRDVVRGSGGEDFLHGGQNGDTISGGKANDKLRGAKGKDDLDGGGGTDDCKGGPGRDSARKCETGRV